MGSLENDEPQQCAIPLVIIINQRKPTAPGPLISLRISHVTVALKQLFHTSICQSHPLISPHVHWSHKIPDIWMSQNISLEANIQSKLGSAKETTLLFSKLWLCCSICSVQITTLGAIHARHAASQATWLLFETSAAGNTNTVPSRVCLYARHRGFNSLPQLHLSSP